MEGGRNVHKLNGLFGEEEEEEEEEKLDVLIVHGQCKRLFRIYIFEKDL